MGEAQDLIDDYGWGGEDDNYNYGRREPRFPSQKAKWKNRETSRKLISDPEAEELAYQIARLKEKIKDLQLQEEVIRLKLEGAIPVMAYVNVSRDETLANEYIVEHIRTYNRESINPRRALSFILNQYGEEALLEFAEQCSVKTRKQTAIYVRPFHSEQSS